MLCLDLSMHMFLLETKTLIQFKWCQFSVSDFQYSPSFLQVFLMFNKNEEVIVNSMPSF